LEGRKVDCSAPGIEARQVFTAQHAVEVER
jgi:hypothetical protein